MNLMPVIAANRIGKEEVKPCAENGGQESSLIFYGSSFITDELAAKRLEWGLFRDRRPKCYGKITE